VEPYLSQILSRLAAGASRHRDLDAASRARLALETARSTAAAAADWVAVAVDTKHGAIDGGAAAEETATGPLATLRILLITARCLVEVAREGKPRPCGSGTRFGLSAGGRALVGIDVLPEPGLGDGAIFGGHRAEVRCIDPGGPQAFDRAWREEAGTRPAQGGVALVLGAGNVTGLPVADAIGQIFGYGRAVVLKLHPVHAALEGVLRRALSPLIEADLLDIVAGGNDLAAALVAAPDVSHVHLTGGQVTFDAVVWGGPGPRRPGDRPRLEKPITCELGNVTPWIVLPGRYTAAELRRQADCLAASIINNTSFNCIATKCVITCRSWDQRDEFLAAIASRLAAAPARPAWYPGATALWERFNGVPAPADGSLPWRFRTGIDPALEPALVDREWFVPVAVEVPVDADGIDAFCGAAHALVRSMPGSLAVSVTVPRSLSNHEERRAATLVDHLEYGVVAVNTWSALAYAAGSIPWGGFPGATLAEPASGIGWVHDPLLLPLVHNTILRAPLASWLVPAWFPWHAGGRRLASGVVAMYTALARGKSPLPHLAAMLPAAVGQRG
jgi:hypothetical protein